MNKEVSLYLDVVRFFAALLVVFAHFSFSRFSSEYLNYFHQFGQTAVIIFFVLSGYVISYVADMKENNIKDYFISRFSRLYSVVMPVLLLVLVFDSIGQFINSSMYDGYFRDSKFIIRLIANGVFLQQIWFYGIGYLSDGPLWSLGYEFWYYVLFGFSLFLKGKKKYLFLILTALLIGPKILLLLPVWLFGVWIYNFHKTKDLNQNLARVIFILSPILFLFCFTQYNEINSYIYSVAGENIQHKLGFSAGFITDYITGFFIGVHILSMKYINFTFLNKMLWGGGESDTIFCK